MNTQLYKGRPFFTDIAAQGIALYEAEGHPLSRPGKLQLGERLAEARQHFDRWIESAARRQDLAETGYERGYLKEAAFDFHQASEQLYHCALLTLTLYSPLCRARHNGDYAERRTIPMPAVFPPTMRRLGELRAA